MWDGLGEKDNLLTNDVFHNQPLYVLTSWFVHTTEIVAVPCFFCSRFAIIVHGLIHDG